MKACQKKEAPTTSSCERLICASRCLQDLYPIWRDDPDAIDKQAWKELHDATEELAKEIHSEDNAVQEEDGE